jgi:hypothetical protein
VVFKIQKLIKPFPSPFYPFWHVFVFSPVEEVLKTPLTLTRCRSLTARPNPAALLNPYTEVWRCPLFFAQPAHPQQVAALHCIRPSRPTSCARRRPQLLMCGVRMSSPTPRRPQPGLHRALPESASAPPSSYGPHAKPPHAYKGCCAALMLRFYLATSPPLSLAAPAETLARPSFSICVAVASLPS